MTLALANLLQIALIAVATLGFALTVMRRRLRALAALMAMAVMWMVFNFLEETAGFREIWLVSPAFRLAYPPLFYLFARGLIFRGASLGWRDWPHGIPFLAALFLTEWIEWVELAARVSMLVYAAASIRLVHRFHLVSRERRSDAQQIGLYWLYGVIAVYLIDEVYDIVRMDLHRAHEVWPWLATDAAYSVSLLISLVMTTSIIVLAMHRQSLFEGLAQDALARDASSPGAQPAEETGDFARLDALVRREALYTEPRLTRAELAQAAGLPERAVSRTVKAATGRSFNDYINALRIEDVRAMLADKAAGRSEMTVLDMAYTAGFSSKSVFNAVFRRETGLTPSAYLQRLAAGGPAPAS